MSIPGDSTASGRALLSTLSDDLALPLIQIKTSLELFDSARLPKSQKDLVDSLGLSAESGLQLLEAYRLAMSLADTSELPLEPVAIGTILSDVAHQLGPLAKRYQVEIWVDTQSQLKPALAHSPSLVTALNCLGVSLIRAVSSDKPRKKASLLLGAHRAPDGQIITGVFSTAKAISDQALRSARGLQGKARQPISGMPAGSSSGVLVADMLCARMWSPLRAASYQNLNGLATLVPISKQLNLV